MITVQKLSPFPKKCNPFRHDLFHMGVELGKNVVAMYVNDKDGRCDYVIIINTETGERIQVNLTQDAENKKNFAKVADRILKYGKLDGHDN